MRKIRSSANRALVDLKRQVQPGRSSGITHKTNGKLEDWLGASGGNLVYSGYPYDPC